MDKVYKTYKKLYDRYGPQGWWPIIKHKGCNPTKAGCIKDYHPKDYSFPRNKNEIFEICIGAILTQNTNWPNVEKALLNLEELKALNPKRLLKLDKSILKQAIRPAGYYNQKAEYVLGFTKFFIELKGNPSRQELLAIKGIGNETADSMLLYAFQQPEFVVDAYTKRIFSHLGLIKEKATYHEIKELFEKNLPKDIIIYQEYHALLVEHAKHCYKKKPFIDGILTAID